jgi:hypothetical protein
MKKYRNRFYSINQKVAEVREAFAKDRMDM